MTLKELKQSIENRNIPDTLLIFVNNDNSFLSQQYTKEIAKVKNLPIEYLPDLSSLEHNCNDIFGIKEVVAKRLRVYNCDKLEISNENIIKENNLILVCNSISDDSSKLFKSYIIKFPKLEDWMIKDYAYSQLEGADENNIELLLKVCGSNISRLALEIEKVSIFNSSLRKEILNDFIHDGIFQDLSDSTIFTLSNAIQSKDLNTIRDVLMEIKNIDVEPIGLVRILWQNFRKMIMVWLSVNPTTESTGLKQNQIYAIKHIPRMYYREQLVKVFQFITDVDYKMKSGYLPINVLLDYVILKVLSF